MTHSTQYTRDNNSNHKTNKSRVKTNKQKYTTARRDKNADNAIANAFAQYA